MQWTKPEFVEIPLGMEVTAYANTEGTPTGREPKPASSQEAQGRNVRETAPPRATER